MTSARYCYLTMKRFLLRNTKVGNTKVGKTKVVKTKVGKIKVAKTKVGKIKVDKKSEYIWSWCLLFF